MNRINFKPIHGLVLGMVAVLGLMLFIPFGMYISTHNKEVALRNQFKAQQEVNTQVFDNVWKVIQQQTEVTSKERETFKETFVDIMDAQKGVAGNGSLASFFTQAKVDISPELYSKLMTSIEAQRFTFLDSQRQLLEIKKDHDNLLDQFPSSIFVGWREVLVAKTVTSTKTQEIFSTGVEDDVKLFD